MQFLDVRGIPSFSLTYFAVSLNPLYWQQNTGRADQPQFFWSQRATSVAVTGCYILKPPSTQKDFSTFLLVFFHSPQTF